MSINADCRREELSSCQPDRTIIVAKPKPAPDACEKQTMTEKQFMRDHSIYSAISSWLFAISGATNIGVLGVVSQKVFAAVEKGLPLFKSTDPKVPAVFSNKKYNNLLIGMTAFGGLCMCVSNWLESKKVVTEWQLGAGKLQRKSSVAEADPFNNAPPATPCQAAAALHEDTQTLPNKKWAEAIQPKATIDNIAHHLSPG